MRTRRRIAPVMCRAAIDVTACPGRTRYWMLEACAVCELTDRSKAFQRFVAPTSTQAPEGSTAGSLPTLPSCVLWYTLCTVAWTTRAPLA